MGPWRRSNDAGRRLNETSPGSHRKLPPRPGSRGMVPIPAQRDYLERVSSNRTEALFVVLTLLSLFLFAWRSKGDGLDSWSVVFFCLFVFFLFYSLNFRTLRLRLTAEDLQLKFGLFVWTIPLRNKRA